MNQIKSRVICMVTLLLTSLASFAQWKQVLEFPTAQAVFVTKSGNVLASNYMEDYTGGIMVSGDHGETWTKTDAEDYNYNFFVEGEGEIYATGTGCILSRSTDNGKTWQKVDYSEAAAPLAPKGKVEYCTCYGATFLGNRLYIADFMCGVFYTDDHGETWHATNHSGLTINDGYDSYIENLYALAVVKDKLYAFGLYNVYRYNETTDRWMTIRDSNCMAVNTMYNDTLVCGRAIMDNSEDAGFLLWTTNGTRWGTVERPQGQPDNYVRALTNDNRTIYVGLLTNGFYYTSDFGKTWKEMSEGLPRMNDSSYYFLISLANDNDYVYAAIYASKATVKESGIYRISKADMLPAGVSLPTASDDVDIRIDNGTLTVQGSFERACITELSGRMVASITSGVIDLSVLPKGIYVCHVLTASGMHAVKFVNK